MDIRNRVERLAGRLKGEPQYNTQGAVLFVDLERRETRKGYLPVEVFKTFLSNRGANMFLLYNLMDESLDPLDPQQPLIFGAGTLTSNTPGATRGNVSSISVESRVLQDASCGDYFPSFMRRHGYDHIVLYGRHDTLTMMQIEGEEIKFLDASKYRGMDNLEFTEVIETEFEVKERKTMAMARITSAGENGVLSAGIMGGIKAIWARGGPGAKMGSLNLKAIMVGGKPPMTDSSKDFKVYNKGIGKKILGTSVIKNALKTVGTPFLYKPSRVLGAMMVKNNQETTWVEELDADNMDPYRTGMDGCYQCPVKCRAMNDMTPEGKGGFGAHALKGVTGNASYKPDEAQVEHDHGKTYNGINDDGNFDKYDKGDGPEYVTLGKFGPNLGIKKIEHVLRFNNMLNDLGLDSASAGGCLSWAFELYQRGIITTEDTGGLELTWGNYEVIEKLLFMMAKREGFGDTLAHSTRAVERGKYPEEALKYMMASKGLFQSDPHDSRILKAFALGLSVATRGMDHLRNRVTLEINARVNDNPEYKTELYGGFVSARPDEYEGKEIAVRKCEDTFAAGDSVGMCRFNTKLFNSPNLPDPNDFATQVSDLTGVAFTEKEIEEVGRNVVGLERMINFRLGIRAEDDTLPRRWFEEPNNFGPFKGAIIDRKDFADMRGRFYEITGLNSEGLPKSEWHAKLSQVATGFTLKVDLPSETPGAPEQAIILDEPVTSIIDLRAAVSRRLPEAAERLKDPSLSVAINGEVIMSGEAGVVLKSGDEVTLMPMLGGG
jgi:aldehyde:ferredoxin oxidoreductase